MNPVNFYLAVQRPNTVWRGRVGATLATGTAYMSIPFSEGTNVTGTYGVAAGYTVWFGSGTEQSQIGMARLRPFNAGTFTPPTGTFTVGENSDTTPYIASGTYLTIKEEYRLWSIFPRIVLSQNTAVFFEDYDISYFTDNSDYPPQAVAPPPAVVFLQNGSGTVSFVGDSSFSLMGNSLSYLWTANGSIEGTSTSVGTAASPVVFSWTTPGTYIVSLTVIDSGNGKSHTAYTSVFVFDRNAPVTATNGSFFTNFDQMQVSGDYMRGGYEARFTVRGDFTPDYFPDGAMVVMFTDGDLSNRTATFAHRSNIFFVGYISKGSVVVDWRKNQIQFSAATIDASARNLTMYPAKMTDESTQGTWTQFQNLNVRRILRFLVQQRSTLASVTPVLDSGLYMPVKAQDVGAGNLWSILTKLAADCCGYIASSMQGVVGFQRDYQLMLDVERSGTISRRTLSDTDWFDSAEIGEIHYWGQPVNTIKVDGIYYPGGGSSASGVALFSIAPGVAAHNEGQTTSRSGLILTGQSELNARTGRLLAKSNNKYPTISMSFFNAGEFDFIPQETFGLTVDAERFSFDGTRILPRRISHTLVNKQGIIRSRVEFEPEVFGRSGTTIIMPPPRKPNDPPAPYVPPPDPDDPPPPPPPTPPRTAPILVSVFQYGGNIALYTFWTRTFNTTKYYLERSLDGVSGWSVVAITDNPTTTFVDYNVVAGRYYYYRVRGWNKYGFSPYSNIKRGIITEVIVAVWTTNFDYQVTAAYPYCTADPEGSSLLAVWSPYKGDDDYSEPGVAYYLERRNSSNDPWGVIFTDLTSDYSYMDDAVIPLSSFYYRVRARVSGTSAPYWSTYSNIATGTARLCQPLVQWASGSSCNIQIAFHEDNHGYATDKIYRAIGSYSNYLRATGVVWTQIDAITVQGSTGSYLDVTLPYYAPYTYMVNAEYASSIATGSARVYATAGCTPAGQAVAPQHVIIISRNSVQETTDFGHAIPGDAPTWTDISPRTGTTWNSMFIDESTNPYTYYIMGDNNLIWKRIGNGAWSEYLTLFNFTQAAGVWQSEYDPNNQFPGCDITVHYTPNGFSLFSHFVGNQLVFYTYPGASCPAGDPRRGYFAVDITDPGSYSSYRLVADYSPNHLGIIATPHFIHDYLEGWYADFSRVPIVGQHEDRTVNFDGSTGYIIRDELAPGYYNLYTQGDSYDHSRLWWWSGVSGLYQGHAYGITGIFIPTSEIPPNNPYGFHATASRSHVATHLIYPGLIDPLPTYPTILRATYVSRDGGATWQQRYSHWGEVCAGVYAVVGNENFIFRFRTDENITQTPKLYVSDNDGYSWEEKHSTLNNLAGRAIGGEIKFIWGDPASLG